MAQPSPRVTTRSLSILNLGEIPDQEMGTIINILQAELDRRQEGEQFRTYQATIQATPYDGALAFFKALERIYGFSIQVPDQFGSRHQIQIVVDAEGNRVTIPWGNFTVPGLDGEFSCSSAREGTRTVFSIRAKIRAKNKIVFDEIVRVTQEVLREQSIYRKKALSVTLTDGDGDFNDIPEIKFVDLASAFKPILPPLLERRLETHLLSRVRNPQLVKETIGTLRMGALLAGPYGTGKTISARYIAKTAVENGFTFIYCAPRDLVYAYDFARLYQPAILFVEDIEEVAGLERDQEVNDLLSQLDGIDSKDNDIIIVYSSNHMDRINPAMRRPGRINLVLLYALPTEEEAIRLVNFFTRGKFNSDELNSVGGAFAGMIPAAIEEVVHRARFAAQLLTGNPESYTPADLIQEATAYLAEREFFEGSEKPVDPISAIGNAVHNYANIRLNGLQPK